MISSAMWDKSVPVIFSKSFLSIDLISIFDVFSANNHADNFPICVSGNTFEIGLMHAYVGKPNITPSLTFKVWPCALLQKNIPKTFKSKESSRGNITEVEKIHENVSAQGACGWIFKWRYPAKGSSTKKPKRSFDS